MGQTVKTVKNYSADFKKSAALEMLEDQRGVREMARKYSVNHCMIQRWIKQYLQHGPDGLKDSRALKHEEGNGPVPPKRRPKKPNAKGYIESELPEVVQHELRQLRMENAYLKKLNTLVQKKKG